MEIGKYNDLFEYDRNHDIYEEMSLKIYLQLEILYLNWGDLKQKEANLVVTKCLSIENKLQKNKILVFISCPVWSCYLNKK